MIIRALRAENFLKYQRLNLSDLPESGLIAISGANESGKSSIGETLCFALFGRTYSLTDEGLHKLIRWDADHCSVVCDFSVGDHAYRLARYLDHDGVHNATLTRGVDEVPFAIGKEQVAEALYDLVGFEYEEFIDSFYLAQREIIKPHPHSYTVKTMAGITAVEYVLDELDEEKARGLDQIASLEAQQEALSREAEALGFVPESLDQMEQGREEVRSQADKANQLEEGLRKAGKAYQESIPAIAKTHGSRYRSITLALLFLALSANGGGLWWLLGSSTPNAFLGALFADWQAYRDYFLYGAVAAGVFFLALLIRHALAGVKIESLNRRGLELADVLGQVIDFSHRVGPLEQDRAVMEGYQPLAEEGCLRLQGSLYEGASAELKTHEVLSAAGDWLRQVQQIQHRRVEYLGEDIQAETLTKNQFETLQHQQQALADKIAEHQDEVDLRTEAEELLSLAGRHMSRRFNNNLRDLAGRTLPLFTEDRYQHLQIDDELNVRVFSIGKRDYMDLEEVSSGTQRQIMLAVRLALAQQMVDTAVSDRQFVFLDEPFAFFDANRTRHSLKVMHGLSEDLTQIWVVAQEFPQGESFEKSIYCDRDKLVLSDADAI
jgi:exonuclease SbcC